MLRLCPSKNFPSQLHPNPQIYNVLVAGASSGIGRAIAIRFAKEGANVTIHYDSQDNEAQENRELMERTCNTIKNCKVKGLIIQADISKDGDVNTMFEQVLSAFGGLDVLINNAGIQIEEPTHDMEQDKFDEMVANNLRGAHLCANKAIQYFLAAGQRGVIINNASVYEIVSHPNYENYAVSKDGIEKLTRTLALEYADQGIRVNPLGPGATATTIIDWTSEPGQKAEVDAYVPIGRAGTPDEMAAVVAFIASDGAAHITGQTLVVGDYIDRSL